MEEGSARGWCRKGIQQLCQRASELVGGGQLSLKLGVLLSEGCHLELGDLGGLCQQWQQLIERQARVGLADRRRLDLRLRLGLGLGLDDLQLRLGLCGDGFAGLRHVIDGDLAPAQVELPRVRTSEGLRAALDHSDDLEVARDVVDTALVLSALDEGAERE